MWPPLTCVVFNRMGNLTFLLSVYFKRFLITVCYHCSHSSVLNCKYEWAQTKATTTTAHTLTAFIRHFIIISTHRSYTSININKWRTCVYLSVRLFSAINKTEFRDKNKKANFTTLGQFGSAYILNWTAHINWSHHFAIKKLWIVKLHANECRNKSKRKIVQEWKRRCGPSTQKALTQTDTRRRNT